MTDEETKQTYTKKGEMAHKIFSELLNFNEVHVHTELIKEQIIEVMDKL